jgi:phosphatidylserine decarboxylase
MPATSFSCQRFKGNLRMVVDFETHDGKISIQIGGTTVKSINTCHFSMLHGICSSSGPHKHFNQQLSCASTSKPIEDGLPSLISTTDVTFASILSSLFRKKGVSCPFQPSDTSIHRAVYAAVVYCFHTSRMLE